MPTISSQSPSSPRTVQQPQTQVPKAQQPKSGGPGFWEGVAKFFQQLFRLRPVTLTSKQKLLVGPSSTGASLGKIPDRMWKAVGLKKAPSTPDSSLARLDKSQARELLTNAKLYALIRDSNYPRQPPGWENSLSNPKNDLLPSDFRTRFTVKKGLVMDSKTGFVAAISFNKKTGTMSVGFTGNAVIKDLTPTNVKNCIHAVAGGVPNNFKQADQMVGALKKHIDALNEKLKQQNKPPIKLQLNGYCMGGGMAAYAGGKNKVAFNTFNPMPLGLGLQIDMGKEALQWANNNGKRYIMESDMVSDKNTLGINKTAMSLFKCQTPGQAMVVPREYLTRTEEKGGEKVQVQDVHPMARHMIENLAEGKTFKKPTVIKA